MVFYSGEGAEHQPCEQCDDGEGQHVQKRFNAEKAENQADYGADNDGGKKKRAFFEFFEKVAERIQQFFVQAENYGDGRAAYAGHDNRKAYKCAEQAALCNLFPVFVPQRRFFIRMIVLSRVWRGIGLSFRQFFVFHVMSSYTFFEHCVNFAFRRYFVLRAVKAANSGAESPFSVKAETVVYTLCRFGYFFSHGGGKVFNNLNYAADN